MTDNGSNVVKAFSLPGFQNDSLRTNGDDEDEEVNKSIRLTCTIPSIIFRAGPLEFIRFNPILPELNTPQRKFNFWVKPFFNPYKHIHVYKYGESSESIREEKKNT